MLEIISPVQGEVLNHRRGRETAEYLEIEVQGFARENDRVTVNGKETVRRGGAFSAVIRLTQKVNEITALAEGGRGSASRTVKVIWDKASFRRINFCIDDHIFFLREIAQSRPASLFDHFYLKRLKEIHQKYGMLTTLNLFYEDSRTGFRISEFPDCYKREWEENSDWLKLAFHAKAEFPDRIYQNAEVKTVLDDYDQVAGEIRRFAGESSLIAPDNIHWSMIKPEAIPGLRQRGVTFLGGLFLNARTYIGEAEGEIPACDVGYFLNEEDSRFLQQYHIWHSFRDNVTYGTESIVVNLEEMPELKRKIAALIADPNSEALHLLTHEQYSFPCYENYLPDHLDRVEYMAKSFTDAGFKFVFFSEGFLGSRNWEK